MSNRQQTLTAPETVPVETFSFQAVDVTGTHRVTASDVQRNLPAGAVAQALAARMSLPVNVPWSLHDSQGTFLDDQVEIGAQIKPGDKVTVSPKTHLG